ncbi:RNA-directed DNA polymerase [Nodosilinea sp. E11]|uniref:RNA-directed DNA polymerase n=1 Tax=Nodosilinea sp. E11 TaxID=3037479 RepID=UPI002934CA31|nr:RNA-directed DNA polymerase [Nodosilinea sp. E11]WOD40545.1 RNA-directed DNA polymerase [Nodosilinea sp. E11]
MKVTKRFHILRSKDLESVFHVQNLVDTWRGVVRDQLRSLDILDLHDYYDFNFNIEDKALLIQKKILDAQYRITGPLIYKLEKKYGVCRHILLLSPSDALVLQTIVDMGLAKQLLKAQPTSRSYYTRDSKNPKKMPDWRTEKDEYGWRNKWKNFQKEIWKFSKQNEYTVVTDLANYYENIGIRELRHIISSYVSVPEVVLDLLFNMIEQLSWVPDYLPTSLKGLPVINLEAPKLLAHALLYEVDEVLNEATDGCFVRWMDDINFGVDSFDKACITLSDTNDVLKSRGLSLNLGKTNIYTAEEVARNFMIDTHEYLDSVEKILTDGEHEKFEDSSNSKTSDEELEKELYDRYLGIKDETSLKAWEKTIKRFLTIFGKLRSEFFLRDAKDIFIRRPGCRKNVIYYLEALGYRESAAQIVEEILKEVRIYDGVALFYIVKLLTDWQIDTDEKSVSYINRISLVIRSLDDVSMNYYCLIWFAAKYFKPNEIIGLIQSTESVWKSDNFLSRQVVSVVPRYMDFRQDRAIDFLDAELTRGIEDSASVAGNIKFIRGLKKMPFRLNSYLFPTQKQKIYPLPKYLILLSFLGSNAFKYKKYSFQEKIRESFSDPWYIKWIDTYID